MSENQKMPSAYGSERFRTIDEYHAAWPKEIRDTLDQLRATIKQTVPQAKEVISYNMPAFKLTRILAYYAVHKEHIGFYPTASPIIAFREELKNYKTSKGTIQFPFDKKLPVGLIRKIVLFKTKEILEGKTKSRIHLSVGK
jgi:uncharacterized protein YdhG (YjbR/CyaY superfamily)